jgi:hypothetical protein
LFNVSSAGTAVAGPVTTDGVVVTNGLFTVLIDVGPGVFAGTPYWLQIGVETNGGNTFSTLTPRQQLTPTPYALYSPNAGNAATALNAGNATNAATATTAYSFSSSLAGDVTGTQSGTVVSRVGGVAATNVASGANAANAATNANIANAIVSRDAQGNFSAGTVTANSFAGSGSGLTNVNASTLGGYDLCGLPCYWNLKGNAGTTPGVDFLGTTDDEPLEIKANNVGIGKPDPATALDVNGIVSATGLDFPATQVTADIINSGPSYLLYADNKGDFFSGQQAGASTTTGTSGTNNTGGGVSALANNTGGTANTAYGFNALYQNTSGVDNTANGAYALRQMTSGNTNIALGYKAGFNFVGGESGNIDIGNQGIEGENNIIRIGTQGSQTNTYVAGIYDTTIASNSPIVVVNSSGQLGTMGTLLDDQLPGNGSITINTGNGLTGGGVVPLGGSITLNLDGNLPATLTLPATGVAKDIIYSGSQLMLYGDNDTNFFVGQLAGQSALFQAIGGANTGIGVGALYTIGSGNQNTADGAHTLDTDTSGSANTAVGYSALASNTTGNNNIALGDQSGQNITTGNYNIDIGSTGVSGDTGIIRLGAAGDQNSAYIAGIYTTTLPANSPLVGVTSSGQVGTISTGVGIGTNNPIGAPLRVVGSREGNSSDPIVLIENLDTTISSSSALRVIAHGGPTDGALSVSTSWPNGSGTTNVLIARFGNAQAYVSSLDNNGNWTGLTFNGTSDRNAKENFEWVSPLDVLNKVSALPISRWNYKADKGSEHIGPMAQDFHAAFNVGTDDKHIATVDEEGIALAAIQGLNQKVEEKDAEITELKARLDRLEQALSGK